MGHSFPPATGANDADWQPSRIRGADEDAARKQCRTQALMRGLALRHQRYSGVQPTGVKFATWN